MFIILQANEKDKQKQAAARAACFASMGYLLRDSNYLFMASCTETATATVMPTIGLLPAPMRPIIST